MANKNKTSKVACVRDKLTSESLILAIREMGGCYKFSDLDELAQDISEKYLCDCTKEDILTALFKKKQDDTKIITKTF